MTTTTSEQVTNESLASSLESFADDLSKIIDQLRRNEPPGYLFGFKADGSPLAQNHQAALTLAKAMVMALDRPFVEG